MDDGNKDFSIFWFIENYSYCSQKNGERLDSPPFTIDWLEGTSWNLRLYPRGKRDKDKGILALCLVRSENDDGPKDVSVNFELSVLAADGSTDYTRVFYRMFNKGRGHGSSRFLQAPDLLSERRTEHLPRDTLTAYCKIYIGEEDFPRAAPICARTRIGIEKFSFMHVIENLRTLEPNKKHIIEIRSHTREKCFARSSVHLTGCPSPDDLEMVIEITPTDRNHILSERKIFFQRTRSKFACSDDEIRLDCDRRGLRKSYESTINLRLHDIDYADLPDDSLWLLRECVFTTGLEFQKIGETFLKVPGKNDENLNTFPSSSKDMKSLYVNQCLADVELKTNSKSFPAHKSVLCARSPVFKAMLTSNVKEKQDDCVQIDDLEDEVLQHLLLFLYSDTVENLQWELAIRLYYAADKYDIGKLKRLSLSFLVENLDPTKAVKLLLLTDTHSDGDLKKSVEQFILENEEDVFGSEEWDRLLEVNPQLAGRTMQLKYKKGKLE